MMKIKIIFNQFLIKLIINILRLKITFRNKISKFKIKKIQIRPLNRKNRLKRVKLLVLNLNNRMCQKKLRRLKK
jgi:hypothetical protein